MKRSRHANTADAEITAITNAAIGMRLITSCPAGRLDEASVSIDGQAVKAQMLCVSGRVAGRETLSCACDAVADGGLGHGIRIHASIRIDRFKASRDRNEAARRRCLDDTRHRLQGPSKPMASSAVSHHPTSKFPRFVLCIAL